MSHDPNRPLGIFDGAPPPAPAWFDAALAHRPTEHRIDVEGAAIEYLCWGAVGAPGLLLVHGGLAHAWWWAHVAPWFAGTHRVAALSLSGMGRSGWRPSYDVRQYGRELRAVAAAAGLGDAGRPLIVAHSFGCAPAVAALADRDEWAAGGILIDGSVSMKPDDGQPLPTRSIRPFADLTAMLARFRLMPAEEARNPYIVDMIARHSVRADPDGLRWSFDPAVLANCTFIDSRATAIGVCVPMAHVRGQRSTIVRPEEWTDIARDLPAATRFVEIPDAGHHIMVDQPLALVATIRALLPGWPA